MDVVFVYILGILFWVLCALAVSCLILFTLAYIEQHRENNRQTIVDSVYQAVLDELENVEKTENNS